jgi:hypothetical protein
MNKFDWFLLAAFAGFVVLCALSFVPWFQGVETRRTARLAGVGFPLEMESGLRGRATRRLRWTTIGCLIGFAVGYLLLRWFDPGSALAAVRGCLSAAIVGGGFGSTVASLSSQLRPLESSVRLARPRVVTISDYVAPSLRVFAWVTWALCAAFVLFGLVIPDQGDRASALATLLPSMIVLALSGCGLALFEISARIIVGRGQPASSPDDLMWEDAQRSIALREMLEGFLPATLFSSLAVLDVLQAHTANATFTLLPVLVLALWAFYFVFSFLMRNTRRRYLERLWPGGLPPAEDEEPALAESTLS